MNVKRLLSRLGRNQPVALVVELINCNQRVTGRFIVDAQQTVDLTTDVASPNETLVCQAVGQGDVANTKGCTVRVVSNNKRCVLSAKETRSTAA